MGYFSDDRTIWHPDGNRPVQAGDTAGGQLGGTYPNPDVRGVRETSGPTLLTLGAIADGTAIVRRASSIVGEPAIVGSATRAAAQTFNTGVVTLVDLDTSEIASGGSLAPIVDLTNNRIVIGVSGIYRLSGTACMKPGAAPAAGATLRVYLFVNSVPIAETSIPFTGTSEVQPFIAQTRVIAATDYVDLQMYQDTGANLASLTLAYQRPRLQVELIR